MNIKETFDYCKQQLKKAGVEDPAFDALYLFESVFSMSRTDILINGDKEVSADKLSLLNDCIARRSNGEPVQYIIGQWYFMGNTYHVKKGVLIPRDDTQVVVDACYENINISECNNILDLCSGSGIIAITLKKLLPQSSVYAVEKSDVAFSCLEENCNLNKADVKCIHDDLYEYHSHLDNGSFDLLVSNPPYIISDEIRTLQQEVQFEPRLALDGGTDGYDFYRGIISLYSKKLKRNGLIAFEIGEGQFEYIKSLLIDNGFYNVRGYCDLGNTTRAVTAVYNP